MAAVARNLFVPLLCLAIWSLATATSQRPVGVNNVRTYGRPEDRQQPRPERDDKSTVEMMRRAFREELNAALRREFDHQRVRNERRMAELRVQLRDELVAAHANSTSCNIERRDPPAYAAADLRRLRGALEETNRRLANIERRVGSVVVPIASPEETKYVGPRTPRTPLSYVQRVRPDAYVTLAPPLPELKPHEGLMEVKQRPSGPVSRCPRVLTMVRSAELLRSIPGQIVGLWMKDTAGRDDRVRVLESSNANHWDTLNWYRNEHEFRQGRVSGRHILDVTCRGVGAIIFNNSLYCQSFHKDERQRILVRYDLDLNKELAKANLTSSYQPRHAFGAGDIGHGWGSFLQMQIAYDEKGLWVVFGRGSHRNIILQRIDPTTLRVLQTFHTKVPNRKVGPVFMICGVMYALDGSARAISFSYDTNVRRKTDVGKIFPFRYADVSSLHYNPSDGRLYSWAIFRLESRDPRRPNSSARYGQSQRIEIVLKP